ncbi:cobalamin metabolism transcriptional regulator, MerR family [Actinobacteria bacterium OK074]|nr:cobalamin metabolism transcriptional regulator, MerR family [Actinobacteria bacterium OK074]
MGESATPRGQGPASGPEVPAPGLTTGALARRLGVSPTTLRSWDRRYGIGPAVRPQGRHRRWSPRDVAVLETMCRLTAAGVPPAEAARTAREDRGGSGARTAGSPPPATPALPSRAAGALPLGDVRRECRGLARAAVRLDAPVVAEHLDEAVERYGLVVAWEEVMVPVLHAVGRRWASSGDRYVEVEHLLSWHISTTLRRASRAAVRAPGTGAAAAGPVVLACAPGEEHTLPLEALNAVLGELGLPTRMFGAALPAEALVAAVRRLGPAGVVLWSHARATASPALAARIADARWGVCGARRGPLVLLAGPGWTGRPAPGTERPQGLRQAVATISTVYDGGPPS